MQISEMPWFVYVIIVIVVLMTLASVFFRLRGVVRQVARSTKSYRKSTNPVASPHQRFALAVGAINGEQLTANVDSLTTDIDRSRVLQGLAEAWDVTSAATARTAVGRLLSEGHRVFFEDALALSRTDEKTWKAAAQRFKEPERILEYAGNLKETDKTLREAGMITGEDDLRRGIVGWDAGRAVALARLAYDAGFMTSEEAWSAIEAAGKLAKQTFNSWQELGRSYIIGRAMWSGEGMMLDGLISITKGLLKDAESPWVTQPWGSASAACP